MRRADVRKIDDSRPEPVAEVVKPVVAAKPAPKKKKSKFGKD